MGLDFWFPQDVARILTALASANQGKGEYIRALRDVALAFGVVTPPPDTFTLTDKDISGLFGLEKDG